MARRERKNVTVRPPQNLNAQLGLGNGSHIAVRDYQHGQKLLAARAAAGLKTDADPRFAAAIRSGNR
jgi:hypothetical protein